MSTDIRTTLCSLAHLKLSHSVAESSRRDNASLHRWVLLKNSIFGPSNDLAVPTTPPPSPVEPEARATDVELDDPESFMFPEVPSQTMTMVSEAQWLDSLLQDLGDDDDDTDDYPNLDSTMSDPEDTAVLLSSFMTPMDSSDDLASSAFFEPSNYRPYPIVYPPVQVWCEEALPYHQSEYLDELAVPEAIEDTSDDESDTVPTPSTSLTQAGHTFPPNMAQSSAFLPAFVDPASIPLPADRSGLRHVVPHVYIDDMNFYPFELDPLPFAAELDSYAHTEC